MILLLVGFTMRMLLFSDATCRHIVAASGIGVGVRGGGGGEECFLERRLRLVRATSNKLLGFGWTSYLGWTSVFCKA